MTEVDRIKYLRIVLRNNETFDNNWGNVLGSFDLTDHNPNCSTHTWRKNTFGTANQACIQ